VRKVNEAAKARQMDILIKPNKGSMTDAGRRRHLSWGMDFDTRAVTLDLEIEDDWDDQVKDSHKASKAAIRQGLIVEFGELAIEAKVENFRAIGTKPFSVLSYHNALYHQIRQSYVIGAYYPALVGACSLGERILNHLILDLREFYVVSPEYRRVGRKSSIDDWGIAIKTLEAWNVLVPGAAEEFRRLMPLRHRSVHFTMGTDTKLREDALAAVLHMRTIIEQQFGSFANRPWFIPGTKGHVFIRKQFEDNPFVKTYFLPNCPFVGPLFGMAQGEQGWEVLDLPSYGAGEWTDEEFAKHYNERDPKNVVQPTA
jgi:hypothetical protein